MYDAAKQYENQEVVEKIGTALHGRPNSKGGFDLCDCPAHGGHGCLSVDQGMNGAILLSCHAGCAFEAIKTRLREMGLWPEHGAGAGKTTAERARERIEARRKLEKETAAKHKQAATKAKALYDKADMGADAVAHPYNQERGGRWTGQDARRGSWPFHGGDEDALLLPLTDTTGALWSLQAISGTGRPFNHGDKKDYYPSGAKRGHFYTFFPLGKHVTRFFIGEGFFTVQAAQEGFYQATEEPPVMPQDGWIAACDAVNLEPVALAIHAAHPAASIIILADEDEAGRGAANRAALAVGGQVARPTAGLPTGAAVKKGYDFDDLYNEAGAGAVWQALEHPQQPERDFGATPQDAPPPGEPPPYLADTARRTEVEREQRERREREHYQGPPGEELDDFIALTASAKVDAFRERTTHIAEQKEIHTGLAPLDKFLDGLRGERLYIIAAVPGLGKTSLISQLADAMAESGQDVLFFTIEVTERQLMAKSISRRMWALADGDPSLALSAGEIDKGKFLKWASGDLLATYDRACREYKATDAKKGRVWLIQGGDRQIGTDDIQAFLERYKRHFPDRTPVVFLDYFQLLRKQNPQASDKQNADLDIVALKHIAGNFDVPLIAISSLNRSGYNAPDELASLKESGLIEYTADTIIVLKYINKHGHNSGPKDARAEVNGTTVFRVGANFIKNRHGLIGELPGGLLFYPRFSTYTANDGELAHIDYAEELGRGADELKAWLDDMGTEGIVATALKAGRKKAKEIYKAVGKKYRGEEKGAPRFNQDEMAAVIEEAKRRGYVTEVERTGTNGKPCTYIIARDATGEETRENAPRQADQGELFGDEE